MSSDALPFYVFAGIFALVWALVIYAVWRISAIMTELQMRKHERNERPYPYVYVMAVEGGWRVGFDEDADGYFEDNVDEETVETLEEALDVVKKYMVVAREFGGE